LILKKENPCAHLIHGRGAKKKRIFRGSYIRGFNVRNYTDLKENKLLFRQLLFLGG
jgi:hypothetical protein